MLGAKYYPKNMKGNVLLPEGLKFIFIDD